MLAHNALHQAGTIPQAAAKPLQSLNSLQPNWQNRLLALLQAIQQAKAESDAWVAEGRRITGWREPVGFRRMLTRF